MPTFKVTRKAAYKVWREATFEVEAANLEEAQDAAEGVENWTLDFGESDSCLEDMDDTVEEIRADDEDTIRQFVEEIRGHAADHEYALTGPTIATGIEETERALDIELTPGEHNEVVLRLRTGT